MTGVEEDKMLTVRGTSRSSIWSSYKAIVRNSFVSIVDRMCDPFTTQIIRNQQKGAQVLFSQADAKHVSATGAQTQGVYECTMKIRSLCVNCQIECYLHLCGSASSPQAVHPFHKAFFAFGKLACHLCLRMQHHPRRNTCNAQTNPARTHPIRSRLPPIPEKELKKSCLF